MPSLHAAEDAWTDAVVVNAAVHAADVHGVTQAVAVWASHHAAAVEDTETDAVDVAVV